jgi:long-chain fatty acid transport protein
VGLAWQPVQNHHIIFDVQRINYTDVDSISNPVSNLTVLGQPFGSDNGPGFGWDDMTVYKLGYEFTLPSLPTWTWRAGYSHGKQPIPNSEVTLNIFAPGIIEDHVTFGFTKQHGSNMEISFAGMYGLPNSVKGQHTFDPAQQVELEMDQFELEGSIGWRF